MSGLQIGKERTTLREGRSAVAVLGVNTYLPTSNGVAASLQGTRWNDAGMRLPASILALAGSSHIDARQGIVVDWDLVTEVVYVRYLILNEPGSKGPPLDREDFFGGSPPFEFEVGIDVRRVVTKMLIESENLEIRSDRHVHLSFRMVVRTRWSMASGYWFMEPEPCAAGIGNPTEAKSSTRGKEPSCGDSCGSGRDGSKLSG